ncbi:MAG: bifunctional nicotinamidase/pyrazinamidase [Burkholderiales bacterium]|jgi:nicotinamidase/pyrazinamidase|nr:bifunctional nicotinamidase/pyrazinamidase [Burkholderiales bacterium]
MPPSALLLIIDVQNDFLPGGALAVPRGDEVITVVNALVPRFANVIATQDWHPAGHVSFASSHAGKRPFETIDLAYGRQVLWPDHCVQGTRGAALADGLDLTRAQAIVRKGYHAHTDSYSAFLEADRVTPTGLAAMLCERGITDVYCCGLATDFCVAWSALDAQAAGFATFVVEDACRAIDTGGSLAAARAQLAAAGVGMLASTELAAR